MEYRHDDQQRRQRLLNLVDRGTAEDLCNFLQQFHRRPFRNLAEVMKYNGVIDDQIDFIDCTGTKYHVTPLIIAAGKGSFEKTKVLLVHGANPNQQCSTGDTALNLAAHRQKYHIVDLLLEYRANPNIQNQAGKTALHRAVVSYIDENANHVRALLQANADPTVEDRNQRIPLDEAVIANKPEILATLLSHDRTLKDRAYRAAILAARLGHDECLRVLLNAGMDPNITDRTHTSPLHVAVRYLKLPTARLLVSYGADQNMANNRGETPMAIAEYLPADQQQTFLNALIHTPKVPANDLYKYTGPSIPANVIPYVHPLLRSRTNWTLDSDEFRSRTNPNSSVQNLLDVSSGTFWSCAVTKDAFVIFDLKHQYNISGTRIIGCENQSTPKSGRIDVSNAFNGPWLRVQDFHCPLTRTTNDFFFTALKTRFVRICFAENYGGEDLRIQGIGFYGVDMRLVNILREFGLERSLPALLANGINDIEALDEKRDEILNSSDRYLDVNDHFQFIRLTESLTTPKLTYLEWFNPPQSNVIAGEKLQTFSAAGDEGVTDRVRLEEKLETNPQVRTVLMRDLEPIQGRSLVDFPDYSIKEPGRYKVRVVSIEMPDIHTSWHDITVVAGKPTKPIDEVRPRPVAPPPRISPSTPPTDIDDELRGMPNFGRGRFQPTPPRTRPKHDDDDDDGDSFFPITPAIRPTFPSILKPGSQRPKSTDVTTQSEEKLMRSVGTMHEPIQTRNFGNEVQPQTIATQTSFGATVEPPPPPPPTRRTPTHFPPFERSRTPSPIVRPRLDLSTAHNVPQSHHHRKSRYAHHSPSDADYFYNGEYESRTSPVYFERGGSPIPLVIYSDTEPIYDDECDDDPYPSIKRRPRTLSSPRQTPSPYHHQRRRYQPEKFSRETDTSLDSMKRQKNAGVQYEPRPRQERGTTPSIRIKRPTSSHRFSPTPSPSPIRHQQRRTEYEHHPRRDYYDDYEDEDRPPSMHDQSTMADLIVSFDHYTQCEPQPYMADQNIQTVPTRDSFGEHEMSMTFPEEEYVRELPGNRSIDYRQQTIVQPPTLPRPRRSHPSPTRTKRDGIDYTGSNLEVSLHRAQQHRMTSRENSPMLNIGTERLVRQPSMNEYAIPFESPQYVEDEDQTSFMRTRRRTTSLGRNETEHDHSPVRQSRSNGNFYLTSPPIRSVNSSFRLQVTRDD